jgi:hypothetical protein
MTAAIPTMTREQHKSVAVEYFMRLDRVGDPFELLGQPGGRLPGLPRELHKQ